MSTEFVADGAGVPVGKGLSQVERVVDAFVAPSKTFTDILRNASWWLPFLLMLGASLATTYTVDKKVGFDQVQATQIHQSPKREDALNDLPPEQKAKQLQIGVMMTKAISYAIPVFLLVGFAVYALILWACFNFILGAQTTFGQVYATCFYASLPLIVLNLLTILTLYFGGNAESYDFNMPAGTNPAYYLPDLSPVLRALLSRIDVIQLWIVGLTIYGMSIVAKKTIGQATMVVGGLWCIATIVSVGLKAAF